MTKIILPLLTVLVLVSCSKEKSKKWLVIDITMSSASTGLPVDGSFELWYRQGTALPLGEDQLVYRNLGQSSNGVFRKEIQLNKRVHSLELVSTLPFAYGGTPPYWPGGRTYQLSMSSKNSFNVILEPLWYETELKMSNLNCFDQTDSVWIKIYRQYNWSTPSEALTGCFSDSIVSPTGTVYTTNGQLKTRVITKRNGVVDSSDYTFPLEHETLNHVHIDDF